MLNLATVSGPQDVSNLLQSLNTFILALNASAGGLIGQIAATGGNAADATDDALATFNLAPNFFTFSGSLRLKASGALAANGNNKSVKIKINDGTTTVTMTGLNAGAVNNKPWFMETTISRRAASAQGYIFSYTDTTPTILNGNGTATEDETKAWTITVTGTSGSSAANDVTAVACTLEAIR